MEEIIKNLQELLTVPKFLIEQIPIFPDYIKQSIIEGLYFVPVLIVLYFFIELLERFFMKNIKFLVNLIRKFGPLFGVFISVIPECGFQVIAGTYYARKLITRGTLLAFFISCSDDAYPILFLDPSRTDVLIPIIVIKIIVGLLAWLIVDSTLVFMKKKTEDPNAVNVDLNENGCCHHKITTIQDLPGWLGHPMTHTVNILFFTIVALALYYSAVNTYGSAEAVAGLLKINSPISQVVGSAIFGLIPNCAASVFLAVAYVKGVICFPALLAGLVTTTGLGLLTVAAQNKKRNADTFMITVLLLIVGIVVGCLACSLPIPMIKLFA